MNVSTPTTYRTHIFPVQHLRLAVENTRREYAAALNRQCEAWHLYEEAIDDGDREAIRDLLRIAELADILHADAWQDMNAAEAAFLAVIS
jgi:hypothetical protein